MVKKFAGIYFDKNKHSNTYDEGPHHVTTGGGSLRIPDGLTVRFFENADGSGGKSRVFYAGSYEDLSMYPNVVGSRRFDVVKTELGPNDFVEAINYIDVGTGTPYPVKYMVPVGSHKAVGAAWYDTAFANNAIDALVVPAGVCAKVYDDSTSKNFIEFDGPMTIDLGKFNYRNKVTRIDVQKDEWEVIEDIVDWKNGKVLSSERVQGQTAKSINRGSEGDLTEEVSVSQEITSTYERSWNVGGSVTAGVSVEAEGGVPLVGKVTATVSVEATVSGGYSGTDATTTTQTVSRTTTLTVPPESGRQLAIVYDRVKAEYPSYRQLRNKRTGEVIRQEAPVVGIEGLNGTSTVDPIAI